MILTDRQLVCLRMASEGFTAAETAKKLYLAERTVKGNLYKARDLLGARNTTHAVVIAIANGLIGTKTTPAISTRLALIQISRALGYDLQPASAAGGAR